MRQQISFYPSVLIGLFFILCVTWTFNGLGLAIGRQLTPSTPALIATGIFILAAILVLYLPDDEIFKRFTPSPQLPFVMLVSIFIFYLFQYQLGKSNSALVGLPNFILSLVITGLACVCWLRRWDAVAAVLVLGLVSWVAVYDLHAIPFSSVDAMLHWVQEANQSLLAGKNPYSSVGLNYFPALWLPYTAVVLLQLDPRFLNIALLVLLGSGLFIVAYKLLGEQSLDLYYLAIAGCMILILNPGIIHEAVKDQVLPDWIYLAIFAFGLALLSPAYSALGLGLSIAARQTSLIFLPITFIEFRRKFDHGTVWFLLTILLSSVIILPFFFWDATAFVDWTFMFNQRWFIDRWMADQAQANAISLAPPFFVAHAENLLQPIQIVGVGLLTLWFFFKKANAISGIIRRFALVYLVFLLFNPIIWNYYYIQFLLLILFFIFAKFKECAEKSSGSEQMSFES
jgi:hypothetical protein